MIYDSSEEACLWRNTPCPWVTFWCYSPRMLDCEDAGVRWANTFLSLGMTKARPPPAEMLRLQKTFGMYPDGIHAYGPPGTPMTQATNPSQKRCNMIQRNRPQGPQPGDQGAKPFAPNQPVIHGALSPVLMKTLGNRPQPVFFG